MRMTMGTAVTTIMREMSVRKRFDKKKHGNS
jgi:hypothetical protein